MDMGYNLDEIIKEVIADTTSFHSVDTKNLSNIENLNLSKTGTAAICEGSNHFDLKTFTLPKLNKDEILVKVEGCRITDADVLGFLRNNGSFKENIIGTDGTGLVVGLGSNELRDAAGETLVIGDTVVALRQNDLMPERFNRYLNEFTFNSWFASHIILRSGKGIRKTTGISLESRLLVNSIVTICKEIDKTRKVSERLKKDSNVVVAGCTFIGYITLSLLREMGVKNIIAIGGSDRQIFMSEKFGADKGINFRDKNGINGVADKVNSLLGGTMADIVFYCSGSDMGRSFAKKLAKKEGYLCDLGFVLGKRDIGSGFFEDSMPITGRYFSLSDYKRGLDFLKEAEKRKIPLYELFTHRFNLSDIDEAFWTVVRHEGLTVGVFNR